jgi:L-lysine exporter family protein LysE/ArgO
VIDALAALAAGAALGAATGIPLGIVNVALVEAAVRAGRRHATGIALGGALADGTHALLAFVGLAPLLTPDLRRAMLAVSAAVVLGYALLILRRSVYDTDQRENRARPDRRPGFGRGVAIGVGLTLPNPAALAAWVAVAGVVVPEASVGVGIAGAVGVVIGSAAWFALLARVAGTEAMRGRVARWLPRVVAVVLVGFVAVAIARAI